MDEDNDVAAPGQVRPGRGRNQNRNRGRANRDPNWRNRDNGRGHGLPNQQQNALMPLMQIPFGQGFNRRGPRQNLGPRNVGNNTADGNIVRGNVQQNNINDDTKRPNQRPRVIGFRALDEMAKADKEDVIPQLSQKKVLFFELIDRINSENNADLFVLIMQILSKVCQSSFDELKLQFLLEICNSEFIAKLRNYLMDLPYATVKAKNNLYWNNQQGFWTNFIIFCESIINVSPSTALNKCRSLIDGTSKCCLEGLTERHHFVLQEQHNVKLAHLRERLTDSEKEEKIQVRSTVYQVNIQEDDDNIEPPENFRQLSVLPRRDDLLERHPYLRSNVVNGGYRDTEHYLDVQFRLLREDCFGPLRDGVAQFIEDPNRKKYDNIRVFRNVKFVMPYVSNNKVGSMIQLDDNTVKRQKRINWAHSKRFIFGSLLLFTKDNCRSFITATILDREPKSLIQGQIPVSVIDGAETKNLYNNESYVMIESEVYFEPYYHVLKALQDPRFPENVAVKSGIDPRPSGMPG